MKHVGDKKIGAEFITAFVTQINDEMKAQNVRHTILAHRLQCSRAYIAQTLRPGSNMTIKTMVRISDALGLKLTVRVSKKRTKP